MQYHKMTRQETENLLAELRVQYETKKAAGITLDMSRGKPGADQVDLARPILDAVNSQSDLKAEDGTNCGNYMLLDGIPEAKRLMAEIMDCEPGEVFVGGNSSLNLMHDLVTFCMLFPLPGSDKPWGKDAKFLCPVPGYDRHFAVTEHLGIEMIQVPMTPNGPDMDIVEKLAQNDENIKGMWCVPTYSNPEGITYSDETVRRIAKMKPAAKNFRVFWDDAYTVHDLYPDKRDVLLPALAEMKKHGNENNIFMFASTSKISFPGGGIAAIGASGENLAFIKKHMSLQTIGFDKLNQLRHARYFKDLDGVRAHMKLHAEIVRPKFELVLEILERELEGTGIASWQKPLGGYFICLTVPEGCAKRTVGLCKEAGLIMTPAGATHPYGNDPRDNTVRIAPTFPGLTELSAAGDLLCLCAKIAALEKLMAD